MGLGTLEPSLPLYMMDTMEVERWQLGAAFLPATGSYIVGIFAFSCFGHLCHRWITAFVGMLITGATLVAVTVVPVQYSTPNLST